MQWDHNMNESFPSEDLRALNSRIAMYGDGPELILIRGLPGAGKSTLAVALKDKGYVHIEADFQFVLRGKYVFRQSKSAEAHAWCQRSTQIALGMGRRVVVSNTFIRLIDMVPYQKMTKRILIFEATGSWRSVHGVSADALRNMASKWEEFS